MSNNRGQRLKEAVIRKLDLKMDIGEEDILEIIDEEIVRKGREYSVSAKGKLVLRQEVFNAIRRLDILQELLEEEEVTEIMVNGVENIFMERQGVLLQWNKQFESRERLADVIQQMVSSANRMINEANPIVDVCLQDGSRVNAVLPPIAINGPIVTIRKFGKKTINMEQLLELGSLTRGVANFLEQLVIAKYNIFISGGTGSGKTTFLNVLSSFIPREERVITIEDTAELQLGNLPNIVRLETKNENVEGKNEITIRDLLKTALRMRPDRIIVGEVRDAAAIDMLSAFNTGHDGSLSTGHANSPSDMLSRLETLVLMGMEMPLLAVRRQIASALDIVVHLGRLRDKTRKVLEIVEVLGCNEKEIQVKPLYKFEEQGEIKDGMVIGELRATEYKLTNIIKLERAGIIRK